DVFSATSAQARMTALQERGFYPPDQTRQPAPGDFKLPISDCAAPPALPGCLSALLNDNLVRGLLIGTNPAEVQALLDTFAYVDYFVSGQFVSPSFLDTDTGVPADQSFRIDAKNGTARVAGETVTFMLAVPKARP